jgi:hypothetical protein
LLQIRGGLLAFPSIPHGSHSSLIGQSSTLVLVPVRLFPATSTEGTIAFRMIHKPSGKPIKYLKGIETERRGWRRRNHQGWGPVSEICLWRTATHPSKRFATAIGVALSTINFMVSSPMGGTTDTPASAARSRYASIRDAGLITSGRQVCGAFLILTSVRLAKGRRL